MTQIWSCSKCGFSKPAEQGTVADDLLNQQRCPNCGNIGSVSLEEQETHENVDAGMATIQTDITEVIARVTAQASSVQGGTISEEDSAVDNQGTVADIDPKSIQPGSATIIATSPTLAGEDLQKSLAEKNPLLRPRNPVSPGKGTVVDSPEVRNTDSFGVPLTDDVGKQTIAEGVIADRGQTMAAGDQTVQGSAFDDGEAGLLDRQWDRTLNESGATIMTSLKASEDSIPAADDVTNSYISVHERSFQPHRDNAPQRGVDYELMKLLGEGGMGVVYAARQASIDRVVAVKMLKPESVNHPGQRAKFLAEAAVTGDLEHPNIVPIYDLGKNAAGALFYAMKRVQGTPWHRRIAKMNQAENLDVLMRVADAIAFAHDRGVLHRDLKPENVMLGGYGEVLVMDWGLALPVGRRSAGGVEIKPTMGGTPAYMAPEMATGPFDKLGFASDIYLLGAILFEIVTGGPPHTGSTVMKCLVSAARNEIAATEKSGELLDIAMQAMATEPTDRFPSVVAFQQAIRDYRAHLESITLASRAEDDLSQARESADYSAFSRAIFGFEESLTLWSENRRALKGLNAAKLAYAQVAKGKGDLDLAGSLLDSNLPEHSEFAVEVRRAVEEREAHNRRLASLKRGAVGMAAAMFLVITVALGYVINANRGERIARQNAEKAKNDAVIARQEAEEAQGLEAAARIAESEQRIQAQRNAEIAEANRIEAEENREEAVAAQQIAEQERMIAEGAREEEAKARQLADANRIKAEMAQAEEALARVAAEEARLAEAEQRRVADENRLAAVAARDEAEEQRELAEYEAYVARINAAAAKIDDQSFDQARALLAACEPAAGRTDHRNWEWHRLWYLCHRSRRDLPLEIAVETIRFAPDGSKFVVGGFDSEAQVRDLEGNLIFKIAGNGTRVLSADWYQPEIRSASSSSTRLTAISDETAVKAGLIAIGSDDADGFVRICDGATGELVRLLQGTEGHSEAVTSVRFSPDGSLLATASFDRTVKLWDVETGAMLQSLVGHRSWVWSARFSHDGKHLVSASEDGTVRIWDVETGKSSEPFLGHAGPVYAAEFSQDGRWVASGGIDGLVLQWSWDDRSLSTFDHRQAIRDFQAGRPVESRTLRGLRILDGHTAAVRDVRFASKNNEAILVSTGHDHTIRMWSEETGGELGSFRGHGRWVRCCDVSPNGEWIVSAGFDGIARLWEAGQEGETQVLQAQTLSGHDDSILDATFADDGNTIVTASRDRTALSWDSESGEQMLLFREGHAFLSRSVAVLPGQQQMVTAAVDGTVRLWEIADGRELRTFEECGRSGVLAVSSSGEWIVTGNETLGIVVRNLIDDRELVLGGAHDSALTAVAMSADHSRVASADENGRIVIWSVDLKGAQPLSVAEPQVLKQHTDRVDSLVWLESEQLVSAGRDRVAVCWSLNESGEVQEGPTVLPHGDEVSALAVIDAERWLSVTRQGSIAIWRLSQPEPLARVALDEPLESSATSANRGSRRVTSVSVTANGQCVVLDEGLGRLEWLDLSDSQIRRVTLDQDSLQSVVEKSEEFAGISLLEDGAGLLVVGGDAARLMEVDPAKRDGKGWGPIRRVYRSQEALSKVVTAEIEGESLLVTASWDGSLFLWDRQTGKVIRKLEQGHAGRVTAVAFNAAADRLASADDRGQVVIWQTSDGEVKSSFNINSAVGDLIFLPLDDQASESLAIGAADGTVRIVDVDGSEASRFDAHDGAVTALAYFADGDGSRLATSGSDDLAKIWLMSREANSVADLEPLIELNGHSATVNDVSWSSDGHRLLTASDDFTVKVWDSLTGKEVLTLRGHQREVTTAKFNPTGTAVLSAAHDGIAILWRTEP